MLASEDLQAQRLPDWQVKPGNAAAASVRPNRLAAEALRAARLRPVMQSFPRRRAQARRALASLAVLWAASYTGVALAQGEDAPDYSTAQLEAFVAAQASVTDTLAEWEARVAKAPPAQRDQLAIKQERALVAAVKAHDLSPSTYNAIAEQAQSDPALTRRIQEHMTPKPPEDAEGEAPPAR